MNEQEFKIVDAMAMYGGSFVKALAQCFYLADNINFEKLKSTFSEYWLKYETMSNKKSD